MEPFVDSLARKEQVGHALTFVRGLLSDLDHRNTESIAYRFGQKRLPLQWFIGVSQWDDQPLREELTRQIGRDLGDPDGVLVFDPSAFPKSGRESVGVARQWCGRLGKVENCQVAVYLGYVSRHGHTLVDTRLYLPKEWTKDKARMKKAGVPQGTKYRTRHELALEMLAQHGAKLPHRWITGDDEMGRPYWFRRDLQQLGEQYLLAVPSNMLIRDLEVEPPTGKGQGRPPNRPWVRVDKWLAAQPEVREIGDFSLVHGSPREPLREYVTSAAIAFESLAAIGTPHGLHGHTHVPVAFMLTEGDDGRVEVLGPDPGTAVSLEGRRTFLNPGSVGQPRDGDPTSSCLVLDTERAVATWSRAAYDIGAVQRAMQAANLPRRLADRLSVGA